MTATPRTGAIVVAEGSSAQDLLARFAQLRKDDGLTVGGLVQRTQRDAFGAKTGMELVALDNDAVLAIDQKLGKGAGCTINTLAMAAAAMAVRRAVAARYDLVVVNKFSHLEAQGQGLAAEIMLAMAEERPLLLSVDSTALGAWMTFCGGQCALLEAKEAALDSWWAELTSTS